MTDLSELTDSTAQTLATQLLEQWANARRQHEEACRKMVGLHRMIGGLVEMFPAVEDLLPDDFDEDEEPRPRGAEVVRRILADHPGKWFSLAAIVSQADMLGWLPESSNPTNAIRSAAERLVAQKIAAKGTTGDGAVAYKVPDPGPQPPAGYDDEEPF